MTYFEDDPQPKDPELETLENFHDDLLALRTSNPYSEELDPVIDNESQQDIFHGGESTSPAFGLATEALAAGAMRGTDMGTSYDSRVISRMQQAGLDGDFIRQFQGFTQFVRGEVRSSEAADMVTPECRGKTEAWIKSLEDPNSADQLTPLQRSAMAVTILYASQAAHPESGVGSGVTSSLPMLFAEIQNGVNA